MSDEQSVTIKLKVDASEADQAKTKVQGLSQAVASIPSAALMGGGTFGLAAGPGAMPAGAYGLTGRTALGPQAISTTQTAAAYVAMQGPGAGIGLPPAGGPPIAPGGGGGGGWGGHAGGGHSLSLIGQMLGMSRHMGIIQAGGAFALPAIAAIKVGGQIAENPMADIYRSDLGRTGRALYDIGNTASFGLLGHGYNYYDAAFGGNYAYRLHAAGEMSSFIARNAPYNQAVNELNNSRFSATLPYHAETTDATASALAARDFHNRVSMPGVAESFINQLPILGATSGREGTLTQNVEIAKRDAKEARESASLYESHVERARKKDADAQSLLATAQTRVGAANAAMTKSEQMDKESGYYEIKSTGDPVTNAALVIRRAMQRAAHDLNPFSEGDYGRKVRQTEATNQQIGAQDAMNRAREDATSAAEALKVVLEEQKKRATAIVTADFGVKKAELQRDRQTRIDVLQTQELTGRSAAQQWSLMNVGEQSFITNMAEQARTQGWSSLPVMGKQALTSFMGTREPALWDAENEGQSGPIFDRNWRRVGPSLDAKKEREGLQALLTKDDAGGVAAYKEALASSLAKFNTALVKAVEEVFDARINAIESKRIGGNLERKLHEGIGAMGGSFP